MFPPVTDWWRHVSPPDPEITWSGIISLCDVPQGESDPSGLHGREAGVCMLHGFTKGQECQHLHSPQGEGSLSPFSTGSSSPSFDGGMSHPLSLNCFLFDSEQNPGHGSTLRHHNIALCNGLNKYTFQRESHADAYSGIS